MRSYSLACRLVAAMTLATPLLAAPAGNEERGADSVVTYVAGEGSGPTYGAAYFPANVLGLPDTSARSGAQTIDPKQIRGLGLGGMIVLKFDRHPIVDGPGADFTVFENAFNYTIGPTERVYAEPGQVSVSADGVSFVAFPFDSLTLRGCAGATPTSGDRDPADPAVSGGDHFDLRDLGLDTVRYVRIVDVTRVVKDNPAHPLWDPTLNGFDLDAVVVVNGAGLGSVPAAVPIASADAGRIDVVPNPVRGAGLVRLRLERPAHLRVRLIDLLGRPAATLIDESAEAGIHALGVDGSSVPAGSYILSIEENGIPAGIARITVAR